MIRIATTKRDRILKDEYYANREVVANMKILQVNAIEGPNYFHHKPVIRGIVFIPEEKRKSTNLMGDFNKRLLKTFPSLAEHKCSRGRRGGFIERITEGTLLGHVLEHVTIEMLNLAGEEVSFGKTTTLDEDKGEYEVVFSYYSREAAIEALHLACHNINLIIAGQEIDLNKELMILSRWIEKSKLGPTTENIINECILRGIPFQSLGKNSLFQLGYGFRQQRIWASMTGRTSCIAVDIASDKELTRQILLESGIPVPQGKVIETEDELNLFLEGTEQSVVIKPCRGNQGKGVSINIKTREDALKAFRLAKTYDSRVIIEQYIQGPNYRFLILGDRMSACAQRIPPKVTGDGESTIKELVAQENRKPTRKEGHIGYLSKITIDPAMIFYLQRQGVSLHSILEKGQEIFLRESANLSTGAVAVDVTETGHR
jgi:cyanophycin synthetase